MPTSTRVSTGQRPEGGSLNPLVAGAAPVIDSYARLSWNPDTGDLEKIETQQSDNRKTIKSAGAVVGLELWDGKSAWKRNAVRKDFETAIERAESGITQGIAVWHVDRLFRQPRDLERLIDLARRGFRVISTYGSFDLTDPEDLFQLRGLVAAAAKSSDDSSRRIRKRFIGFRAEGRTTGGKPGFGFPRKDREWKPSRRQRESDRPMLPDAHIQRERAAIRKAVIGIADGTTTTSEVARTWNDAGLRTVEGKTWVQVGVRNTLMRSTIAGIIEYEGEEVGTLEGKPIAPPEKWRKMRAIILGRRRGAPFTNRYVGSGHVYCARCGNKLSGKPNYNGTYPDGQTRRDYYCAKSHRGCGRMSIDMRALDAELRLFVIARLSDPRVVNALTHSRSQADPRLTEVRTELANATALQDRISERLGRREITESAFDAANRPLNADIQRLKKELNELEESSASANPGEVLTAEQVAEQWDRSTLLSESEVEKGVQIRRKLLKSALGTDVQIRIHPQPDKRFTPDRVRVHKATDPFDA